jgi:hypothetical protein
LPERGIEQVVEKKMVGDTGFEPVTPTACRKLRKKLRRRKRKTLSLRRASSTSVLIFLHPDGIGLSEGV